LNFCLPPSGTRSATSTTIDFGANTPFTFVPAYNLPVYASQGPLPDTTQDSVRGCRLGFAAVAIPGDMVSCAFKAQPAQIPASGFPAPGSCRRSNATEVRGLGGPFTSSPQVRSFGDTPYPAQSPGRASLLAFPSTGRLPSTNSAADLRSTLFEASQVLCSRPTPHLFHDGFVSSTSRRDPAPPEQCGRDEVSQVPTTFPSYVMGSQTTAERLHLA
jgi:hypothetical protein